MEATTMALVERLREVIGWFDEDQVKPPLPILLTEAVETIERLQAALVGLVGASTRKELEAMEVAMRMMPAPAEDKAASIDAIHVLLSLLPKE